MQIHQIQPIHKLKKDKRVGRGGKKGTYSGKGMKGQSARSGRKMVPIIREIIKRYPKLKGYRRSVVRERMAIVNLGSLEQKFQDGELINPKILVSKGIVRLSKGKVPTVKLLNKGPLNKKIIVENCGVSKTAKETIEKAGGTVKN